MHLVMEYAPLFICFFITLGNPSRCTEIITYTQFFGKPQYMNNIKLSFKILSQYCKYKLQALKLKFQETVFLSIIHCKNACISNGKTTSIMKYRRSLSLSSVYANVSIFITIKFAGWVVLGLVLDSFFQCVEFSLQVYTVRKQTFFSPIMFRVISKA